MQNFRVIPTLLIKDEGLVKGKHFKDHRYVGDPINAVKIFNEKEVDEICILDIEASVYRKDPNYRLIEEIASEAFMPLSYGGGLNNIEQVSRILQSGVEKVIFNTSCVRNPRVISETAAKFGSSSTVVSIDVREDQGNYSVYTLNGTENTKQSPVAFAKQMQDLGAGEIILTSINHEGMRNGYDVQLINEIAHAVNIPVIANGGASSKKDFDTAIKNGASAVAAGSYFVFYGNLEGVLITYDI